MAPEARITGIETRSYRYPLEPPFHAAWDPIPRTHQDATLVLGSGWLEGMTVNTIEPGPVGEASDNGKLSLELGHIPAGEKYVLFMQFQVNPANVGHRTQTVELRDGDEPILTYDKAITVYP